MSDNEQIMINTPILEGRGSGSGIINATRDEARQWRRRDVLRFDPLGSILSEIQIVCGWSDDQRSLRALGGVAGRAVRRVESWGRDVSDTSGHEAAAVAVAAIWQALVGASYLWSSGQGDGDQGDAIRAAWTNPAGRRSAVLIGYRAALKSLRDDAYAGMRGDTVSMPRPVCDTDKDAILASIADNQERALRPVPIDHEGNKRRVFSRWVWRVLVTDQLRSGKGSGKANKWARMRGRFLVGLLWGRSSEEAATRAGYPDGTGAFRNLLDNSAPLVDALVGHGLTPTDAKRLFNRWQSGRV